MTKVDTGSISHDDLRNGIRDGSIMCFFDRGDECDFTQEGLSLSQNPMVYAGAQNPLHYRIYDGASYQRYIEMLRQQRRPVIDPASRTPLTDSRNPFDYGFFRPAYVDGTTTFPPWQQPVPFYPPPPPFPRPVPAVQPSRSDPLVGQTHITNEINWRQHPNITNVAEVENQNGIRFSQDIDVRIGFAIRHYFMGSEFIDFSDRSASSGEQPQNSIGIIENKYRNSTDILGLYNIFHFGSERAPRVVEADLFRGFTGIENRSVIFMRDRPYRHNFQNGRSVIDTEAYIEFFLFIFQAYFYTGLTEQQITVTNHGGGNFYVFSVPYVYSLNPFESRIVFIEIDMVDYMDDTQRWLLKIVDQPSTGNTFSSQMDVRHPVFNSITGAPMSHQDLVRAETERRAELIAEASRNGRSLSSEGL